MLREAVAYPRADERWLRRLGIGGVVILGSFLLVPLFIFFGYIVRVLRAVASGQETPPDFGEIGSLIVDGIKFYGITLAYGLPVILIPLFAGALGQALGLGTSVAGSAPGSGPVVTSILGLLLLGSIAAGVVSVYSTPAAVAHFAYTGSMRAAFDVRTVVGTVGFSRPYFRAYLLAVIVGIALSPVVAALSAVLVGLLVAVYQALIAGYLIGTGYAVSRDLPQDGHLDPAGATPAGTDPQRTVADAAGQHEAATGDETATPGAGITNSDGGSCPECGRSVGANASFCPDCGAEIPDTDGTHSPTDAPDTSGHSATDERAGSAPTEAETPGSQSTTRTDHGADPHRNADDAEPAVAPDSGDRGDTATASSSAQVSPDQLYTDETGTTYVETPIGPDKRLHTDSDGHQYYRRGQAMRAMSAGFAVVCVGFALFAFFALPDMAGGPTAPRGRFLFALIESIPFGNVIVGLLSIWIGYRLAHIAYTGREYIAVEDQE